MKYYKSQLDFEDLEQAGFIGLLKASKKFDVSLGYKFTTIATWCIKQAICTEITEGGQTIKIPANMLAKIKTVAKLEYKYYKL